MKTMESFLIELRAIERQVPKTYQTDVMYSSSLTTIIDNWLVTLMPDDKKMVLDYLTSECNQEFDYYNDPFDYEKYVFNEDGYCIHGLTEDTCVGGCGGVDIDDHIKRQCKNKAQRFVEQISQIGISFIDDDLLTMDFLLESICVSGIDMKYNLDGSYKVLLEDESCVLVNEKKGSFKESFFYNEDMEINFNIKKDYSEIISRAFSDTLEIIDRAILNNDHIDFSSFIVHDDYLIQLAFNEGVATPMYLIKVIDIALTELSIDYKGRYLSYYEHAYNGYYE